MTNTTEDTAPKKKRGLVKLLLAIPIVLVLLVIGLVVVAAIYVDSIAKTGIEQGGTYALGVKTSLNTADVKLLSGGVTLAGLNVDNPEGFTTPHFLALNSGSVVVSLASLRSDTVEIESFELSGIDLNLEKSSAGANYKAILDNLKRLEGSGDSKPAPSSSKSSKTFIIRTLTITDIAVHADVLPIGGELTRTNVAIDQIKLTDVGSKGGSGVEMTQLVSIITKALFNAIAQSGLNLPADLLGDLQGQLAQLESLGDLGISMASDVSGQLESALGDVAGGLQDQAEGVTEEIDKVADEAGKAIEGIGNLLGGGDEKPD